MCFRIHYLDRPREHAAQQRHSPTTLSLRSRLDERRAALMAWLRPFPKPTSPVTAKPEPAETCREAVPRPVDLACTVASTAREREAEAA